MRGGLGRSPPQAFYATPRCVASLWSASPRCARRARSGGWRQPPAAAQVPPALPPVGLGRRGPCWAAFCGVRARRAGAAARGPLPPPVPPPQGGGRRRRLTSAAAGTGVDIGAALCYSRGAGDCANNLESVRGFGSGRFRFVRACSPSPSRPPPPGAGEAQEVNVRCGGDGGLLFSKS